MHEVIQYVFTADTICVTLSIDMYQSGIGRLPDHFGCLLLQISAENTYTSHKELYN